MPLIANYWPQWYRDQFGGAWPRSFCVVDLETSGFSYNYDVITEYAHCLVEDGEIVDHLGIVLDWSNHNIVPMNYLLPKLNSLRQQMELSGRTCHMTIDRMQKEGIRPPEKALKFMHQFLTTIRKKGIPFVLHGGFFDEKMLSTHFLQFQIDPEGFSFGADGFLDTEGIEKASQIVDNERVHPRKGDTLRSYFHRVRYTRVAGVKSGLDEYCALKYKFAEKHGIERKTLHRADVDVLATRIVFEEQRRQLTDEILTPPIWPTADVKERRKTGKPIAASLPIQTTLPRRIRGQRNS